MSPETGNLARESRKHDDEFHPDASKATKDAPGSVGSESSTAGNASTTLATRKSKTKAEREAAKGGKRGPPSRYRGPALKFMEDAFERYVKLPKAKGTKGKNDVLKAFFLALKGEFWGRFTVEEIKVGNEYCVGKGDDQIIAEFSEVSDSLRDVL